MNTVRQRCDLGIEKEKFDISRDIYNKKNNYGLCMKVFFFFFFFFFFLRTIIITECLLLKAKFEIILLLR